tara:strand:- start:199 stop:369 length:171 start_codon:yes stop_codon:yes gene_type:complete
MPTTLGSSALLGIYCDGTDYYITVGSSVGAPTGPTGAKGATGGAGGKGQKGAAGSR